MSIGNHIHQLNHIRSLLTHPAVDKQDILRRVRRVFLKVGYERLPYINHLPKVIRASCQDDAAWFNDKADARYVDIQKFHCPPERHATLQRCNWAGDPVFYCSSENGVPIFEVKPKVGQTIVLSTWVDKRNTGPDILYPIIATGITIGVEHLLASIPDGPIYREFKNKLLKDDIFNPNTPTAIKEIDVYFGKLFTEPYVVGTNLYWFTSAIAKIMLHELLTPAGNKMDCVVYPSVESKISGYNVAINKDMARNRLKVYGAVMYKVLEHDPVKSRYVLKTIKGLDRDPKVGKPVWRNIHPKHDNDRFILDPTTPALPYDESTNQSYED